MPSTRDPLISVILTVFQREQYLRFAIESVLNQTFSSFEIIVTDDSNNPALRAICESYDCLGFLRYRSNSMNLGAPLNLRVAIKEARGKYISILNDDDCWESTFLEKMIKPLATDSRRVLAFSDHWIMLEEGTVSVALSEANTISYGRSSLQEGDVLNPAKLVLEKNGIPLAMASLFRKDALDIQLLSKEVVGAYDFWISCILAASGRPFYYVPERLTRYRVHNQSESARKSPDKGLPMIFIYDQLLQNNWFPSMRDLIRNQLADAFFRCGLDLICFRNTSQARRMFWKAFCLAPSLKKAAALGLPFTPAFIHRAFITP